MLHHLKCMKRTQSRTLRAHVGLRLLAFLSALTVKIPAGSRPNRALAPAAMTPHEHGADDDRHECPAEQAASSARSSDGPDDAPATGRPSTAPQPDMTTSAAQTWGRLGHLTSAQEAHLLSMRRKCPGAGDAEARHADAVARADLALTCSDARTAQLLRWLRARAFSVDKATALKADSEAWHKADRPLFRAPSGAVVEQLLKRGAPSGAMGARNSRAGARAAWAQPRRCGDDETDDSLVRCCVGAPAQAC